MNQPKFKIGDKVKAPGGKLFIVKGVSEWKDRPVMYFEDEIKIGYREDQLEPYQEPQKKKLCAYKQRHSWQTMPKQGGAFINGYKVTFIADIDMPEIGDLERASEYDIEYPSAEQRGAIGVGSTLVN